IVIDRTDQPREVVTVHADRGLYAEEAEHVARCIDAGVVESPRMPWADTLANLDALDRWRRAVGVTYLAERPQALRSPVRGRPVRHAREASMATAPIEGVRRPVSK